MSLLEKIKLLKLDSILTPDDLDAIEDEMGFGFSIQGEEQDDVVPIYTITRNISNKLRNKLHANRSNTGLSDKAVVMMVLLCDYLNYSGIIFKKDMPRYFLVHVDKNDPERIKNLPKLHPEYFCEPNCRSFRNTEEVLNTPYTIILNKDFQQSLLDLKDDDV